MLKELKVQNFALIDLAHITFKKTLVVITGETGAGKSILLDALALTLGGKTDTSILFDKNKKTIVEAIFDISELSLKDFFEANELDYSSEIILRREISADGKSRAFINDTPVTLTTLKSLGEYLIDIHSQHQNLLIHHTSFRYNFVDAIAGSLKDRIHYTTLFKQYQKEKKELQELIEKRATAQKENDYYQFLLNELQEMNIQEGELRSIEDALRQMENAESILQHLTDAIQHLQDAEWNALYLIHQAKQSFQSIAKYHPKYEEWAQRLHSCIIEIKDIVNEAEQQKNQIEINPDRLEALSQRVDAINRLLKKHQVKTDSELLSIQHALEEKLATYQNIDDVIAEKEKVLKTKEQQLIQIADELSHKRLSVKSTIEKECSELLRHLAMPYAQFIVDIRSRAHTDIDEFGRDDIQFLFSANKGIAPAEVQKTASGGEISRLMLSIKYMMAQKVQLPAIIFDEIDTGVSGVVAGKMAELMKKMSENMQVIVITHLPQIAAKGKQHLYVSKEEHHHKSISVIKELNEEHRLVEIAKMLSSGEPGEAAIQNARELLK